MKIDWKNLLNWHVVTVSEIIPVKNQRGSIQEYRLVVSYAHHGDRVLRFASDNEALYAQYGSPLKAASAVRQNYINSMKRQRMGNGRVS